MPRRTRLRTLREELTRLRPDLNDVDDEITAGHVLVDGMPRTNANTLIPVGTSVVLRSPKVMRGLVKIRAALEAFDVDVSGRVALDAGAAAGGFVQGLLERGARKVYAVEVGYGQLLGSLRQDERVVNLERTNIGDLRPDHVDESVEVITLDLGFLALAIGVPQLNVVGMLPGAELIALVKPMSELGTSAPPTDPEMVEAALARAAAGIEAAGWRIVDSAPSPITGSRGAVEAFLYARRSDCGSAATADRGRNEPDQPAQSTI